MEKDDILELPPTTSTFSIPRSELEKFDTGEGLQMFSWETMKYVTEMVSRHMPHKLVPREVAGDGNCLLHAISYAIWGPKSYHTILRRLLKIELVENKDFYKFSNSPEGFSETEYDAFIDQASVEGSFLGFIHIFALANILKRPIIIYASDDDLNRWGCNEEGCCGSFLPTRHGAESCSSTSIALSWSNENLSHFVPLCPIEGQSFEWPHQGVVFSRTLRPGETLNDYLQCGLQNRMSNLQLEKQEEKEHIMEIQNEDTDEFDLGLSLKLRLPEGTNIIGTIGYNYGEDPKKVAKKWLKNAALPLELADFIGEVIENKIASRHTKRMPRLYCEHIPCTNYTIYHELKYQPMIDKVLALNAEIRKTQEHIFSMSNEEIKRFLSMVETIKEQTQSLSYQANIKKEDIQLINKILLEWPSDKIFPILDLARVMILHEPIVDYIIESNMAENFLGIIIKIGNTNSIAYNNRFLILKLLINLFHQTKLVPLIFSLRRPILKSLYLAFENSDYQPKQVDQILIFISNLCLNFSILWTKFNRYVYDASFKSKILSLVMEIIFEPTSNEELSSSLLVCIGTLLEYEPSIDPNRNAISIFAEAKNQKIRDCANYILHLLEESSKFRENMSNDE